MGCHFLLQGIFPAQESNPGLPHYRQTLYCLSHQRPSMTSPKSRLGWSLESLLDEAWEHCEQARVRSEATLCPIGTHVCYCLRGS